MAGAEAAELPVPSTDKLVDATAASVDKFIDILPGMPPWVALAFLIAVVLVIAILAFTFYFVRASRQHNEIRKREIELEEQRLRLAEHGTPEDSVPMKAFITVIEETSRTQQTLNNNVADLGDKVEGLAGRMGDLNTRMERFIAIFESHMAGVPIPASVPPAPIRPGIAASA